MRLVNPPHDRSGKEQDAAGGSNAWKRNPERASEQNQVQRGERERRCDADGACEPHARCGKERIEPEVEEHTPAIDIRNGRGPDVPLSKIRIKAREFLLDVWNAPWPEGRAMKRRE